MVPVKIECDCGQNYAFDVEPVNGRMPWAVSCPSCGADGTAAANDCISEQLGLVLTVAPAQAMTTTATATVAATQPQPNPNPVRLARAQAQPEAAGSPSSAPPRMIPDATSWCARRGPK